jgi:hypothetical protein
MQGINDITEVMHAEVEEGDNSIMPKALQPLHTKIVYE